VEPRGASFVGNMSAGLSGELPSARLLRREGGLRGTRSPPRLIATWTSKWSLRLIVADRIHTPVADDEVSDTADHTGFAEVSLFADAYRRFGHLTTNPVVAVTAIVNPRQP